MLTGSSNPFRGIGPRVNEREPLADAQLPDHVRRQDLTAVGAAADPGGQLDRSSEDAVALGDRLARRDADADLNGISAVSLCSATPRSVAIAHSTAFTTETNDAMMPSPAWSTSVPPCRCKASRTIRS